MAFRDIFVGSRIISNRKENISLREGLKNADFKGGLSVGHGGIGFTVLGRGNFVAAAAHNAALSSSAVGAEYVHAVERWQDYPK
jgi:hypothetical protein